MPVDILKDKFFLKFEFELGSDSCTFNVIIDNECFENNVYIPINIFKVIIKRAMDKLYGVKNDLPAEDVLIKVFTRIISMGHQLEN